MNKPEPEIKTQEFPLENGDIRWGPEEVSLKRDKFEALLRYLQGVSARLVDAEDQLSFQRYAASKAKKEADVFFALSAGMSEAERGIREWLADPENSIQELSRRSGIPYATCHRIINDRLATGQIEAGQLKTLAKAIADKPSAKRRPRSAAERRTREIFEPVLGASLARAFLPEGSKILDVSAKGDLLGRVRKEKPTVVLVDVKSSKLDANAIKSLGQLALNSGMTIVFTGVARKPPAASEEKIVAIGGLSEPLEDKT